MSASFPASKQNADVTDALGGSMTAHSTSIVKSIAMRTLTLTGTAVTAATSHKGLMLGQANFQDYTSRGQE